MPTETPTRFAGTGLGLDTSTSTPTSTSTSTRSSGRRRRVAAGLAATVVSSLVVTSELPIATRLTIATFAVMLVCSAVTRVSDLRLAVGAVAALVVIGASSIGDVVAQSTSSTLWLLGGAFIVAAAAKRSGLAERLALRVTGSATDVGSLFTRVTLMLVVTSFLVPSTAGRAALMVPVFQAIAQQIPQASIRRGLALLFPVNILLSAVASLLGAGAHIVTAELVTGLGGQQLDLVRWTVLGLPFALVSCFVAQLVIIAMFVDKLDRSVDIRLALAADHPVLRSQLLVATVLAVMVVGWVTEPIHGLALWVPAVLGAAILLAPPVGVLAWRDGASAIPGGLLALMVATVEVGKALVRTGAADWIATSLLRPVLDATGSTFAVVTVIALLSLLAHLAVTSRTARASVLIPIVVLIGGAAGIDITAIAFLSTTAAGYCLSSATSAKPMMVFSQVDDAYEPSDLKRLSLVLLPLHAGMLLGFAYVVWPALGMPLHAQVRVGLAAADAVEVVQTSADPRDTPVREQPSTWFRATGPVVAPVAHADERSLYDVEQQARPTALRSELVDVDDQSDDHFEKPDQRSETDERSDAGWADDADDRTDQQDDDDRDDDGDAAEDGGA